VKKQVLVSVDRGETRVALLESTQAPASGGTQSAAEGTGSGRRRRRGRGGSVKKPGVAGSDYRVAELYFERRSNRSIVGNVYKGRVDNVLPGLEAAFIDMAWRRTRSSTSTRSVFPASRSFGADTAVTTSRRSAT
jgi:ribonuclease G